MARTRHLHVPVPAFALGASLFGKLPSALDFVRVNHDHPESVQLDRWLQAGLQRLAARGREWPSGFMQFVFVAAAARHALVGVVAPSRDRAGRRFPITVYGRVPMTALPEGTALLPLASQDFLAAARAVLERVDAHGPGELGHALRRLRVPQPRDLAAESARRREGRRTWPSGTQERSVCSVVEARQRLLQPQRSASVGIECFDCPVASVLDVASWAGIMELTLGHASSYVWSAAPGEPRMLLAPGALPERLALFWATPAQGFPQLHKLEEAACELPSTDAVSGDDLFAEVIARLEE